MPVCRRRLPSRATATVPGADRGAGGPGRVLGEFRTNSRWTPSGTTSTTISPPSHGRDDDADLTPYPTEPTGDPARPPAIRQLDLRRLTATTRPCTRPVMHAIDGNGYLRTDCEELRAPGDRDLSPEEVTTVIHRVQSFDPPGVGARTRGSAGCPDCSSWRHPPRPGPALAICEQGLDYLGATTW